MRALPAALAAELEADAHGDLALLVEIDLPDGSIYRTTWNEEIVFQPDGADAARTYTPDRVEWGEIRATSQQESPSVDLHLQNEVHPGTGAARPWSTVLAAVTADDAINGSTVAWRIVKVSLLSTSTAQVYEETWAIDHPRLEGEDVVFDCGPIVDIFRLLTPEPSLKGPRCRYQYKDENCRSETTHTSCPGKTLAECIARHSELRARISQIPYHDARLTRVR